MREVLVVVESTMAPGSTEALVVSRLGSRALVAHVPQRVTSGRLLKNARTMPRVCGGATPAVAELAAALYGEITDGHIDRADLVTAEVVKTAENAYRDVQIAFANQLAFLCDARGADFAHVRELVNRCPERDVHAAGAGVGGSCLTKDSWLLLGEHVDAGPGDVIAAARRLNDAMPAYVVDALVRGLGEHDPRATRVVVCGLSHRAGSDDRRASSGLKVAAILRERGYAVEESDPALETDGALSERMRHAHGALFSVAHPGYAMLAWPPRAPSEPRCFVLDAARAVNARAARAAGYAVRVLGETHVQASVGSSALTPAATARSAMATAASASSPDERSPASPVVTNR